LIEWADRLSLSAPDRLNEELIKQFGSGLREVREASGREVERLGLGRLVVT
jgi:hypothetical protein